MLVNVKLTRGLREEVASTCELVQTNTWTLIMSVHHIL